MKKFIVATLLTASLLMPFTANANRVVTWQTKISGKTYYATVLKVTKIDRKKIEHTVRTGAVILMILQELKI